MPRVHLTSRPTSGSGPVFHTSGSGSTRTTQSTLVTVILIFPSLWEILDGGGCRSPAAAAAAAAAAATDLLAIARQHGAESSDPSIPRRQVQGRQNRQD